MTDNFTFITRYWRDPRFAARVDAANAARYAKSNAAIDAGMARLNEKQAQRWAKEGDTQC